MRLFTYLFVFGLVYCHKNAGDTIRFMIYEVRKSENISSISASLLPSGSIYYRFKAYEKHYSIYFKKENNILTSAAKIFFHRSKSIRQVHLRNLEGAFIYTGHAAGTGHSSIIGYNENDSIYAKVPMYGEVYYFRINRSDANRDIIFNIKDVRLYDTHEDGKPTCEKMRSENGLSLYTSHKYNSLEWLASNLRERNGISRDLKYVPSKHLCSLEIVADHTYFHAKMNNRSQMLSEMLYHVTIANEIFQNVDIDGDNSPDGIEFRVEKITVFETNNEPGYPFAEERKDSRKFLENLSKYHHPYCLLICFCSRDFWRENDCVLGDITKSGGISNANSNSSREENGDSIFITDRERNFTIPGFRISFNLIHLIGHALGCDHDPIEEICSPGDFNSSEGNYIMHPSVPYGKHPNNWKFSICSLKSMKKTIETKDKYFKKLFNSTCGNGIVEKGESCDCGDCNELSKCCLPPKDPLQCTLRPQMSCSPEVGQCCDESCNIVSKTENKTCFSNKPCWNATATCDGISPFCLASLQLNGTPCLNNRGKCNSGICITPICEYHGLKSCECTSLQEECFICCKNETSNCRTVREMNIYVSKIEFYLKPPGTNCKNNYGSCSSNGTCLMKRIEWKYTWKYFILLTLLAIFTFSFGFYVGKLQKTSNKVEPLLKNDLDLISKHELT